MKLFSQSMEQTYTTTEFQEPFLPSACNNPSSDALHQKHALQGVLSCPSFRYGIAHKHSLRLLSHSLVGLLIHTEPGPMRRKAQMQ